MRYERELLDIHRESFDLLGQTIANCYDIKDVASVFYRIKNEIDQSTDKAWTEEKKRKLEGRGPVNTLRRKLDLAKNFSNDSLLGRIPPEEALDQLRARNLIREIFSTNLIGGEVGGVVDFPLENLKELPPAPENLKSGVYKDGDDVVVVLQWAPGSSVPGYGYIIFTISGHYITHSRVITKLLTFVTLEKEWVLHDHLEVVNYKNTRQGLINLFKRELGTYLHPVKSSDVLSALKTLPTDKVPFVFMEYKLYIDEENDTLVVEKKDDCEMKNARYTNATHYFNTTWNELPLIRQNQIIESLRSE